MDDKASSTALLIARCILLAARDSVLRKLVAEGEPEIIRRILRQTADDRLFQRALARFPRAILLGLERALLPGIISHYLARKRRIELAVREGLASGITQVVVIAAGYDSLCLRLRAEYPDTQFIEIDHPATQSPKTKAFPEAGNFRYIPADLGKDSLTGIFTESIPTVFVIEGLTMYLEETSNAKLIRQIAPHCGKLIFTFMEKAPDGSIDFRNQSPLIGSWLRIRKEPFLWGITKNELPDFLGKCGFRCLEIIDDTRLRSEILAARGLEKLPLAQGECICIAEPASP